MRVWILVILALGLGGAACIHHPSEQANGGVVEVLLPNPSAETPLTWDGWAGAFVRDYCVDCHNPTAPSCVRNGCHVAGDPEMIDFRDRAAVAEHAETIRCGVAATQPAEWNCSTPPRTFPKGIGDTPLPTDEQRAIVVQWLDAGLP